MAKITVEQIAQELEADQWEIISTSYSNLNEQMEFKCPEGHSVYTSWGKLRTRRECPICKANKFKDVKPIIIEKNKNKNRVLALDQASHVSGYSIYDDRTLVTYGTFETKTQEEDSRIHEVKEWMISMIQSYQPDLIAIEGIQYQQSFGVTTFQALARLQGVLIEECLSEKIPYEICPTNTWRAYCGVKGQTRNDKKKSMQGLVKKWFDISVSDDCADAIGIGKYSAERHQKKTEIVSWE